MTSDWPTVSLGRVAASVPNALVGGPFGSNLLARDQVAEGVPVIRGANMGDGRWIGGEYVYVSEEKAESLSANLARIGDIVFTQRGTVGQVALVPDTHERFVVSQSQMKLTPDSHQADVGYLYYYFSAPAQISYMKSRSIQTGVPHTNLGILREAPVVLPPLRTQQAIASILGALDDKIELNRKMSRTLDEMAQAIFKSWFLGAGIDGVAGVPRQGATSSRLDDVVSHVRESVQPSEVDPSTPYVGLEHFDGGSTFLSRWASAEDASSGKSRFCAGDILFGKLRPYFHKVALAPFDGICSTDVMVLRPRSESMTNLALGYVNGDAFIARATAQSEGTRMPRTKWRDVAAYEIVLPPHELIQSFNSIADPIRQRQAVCVRESAVLAEMRDSLLPRLLSGELRIPDAESTV